MKKGALFLITFFVTMGILFIVQKVNVKDETEIVQWNSPNESTTLDFFVGKGGHLFLKGRINGFAGLFLFDTGSENSLLNEKYITDDNLKIDSSAIYDANRIQQMKSLYKIPNFELGAINIMDLIVFPADTLMWNDPDGAFYKQDSVMGIIGNNIISKFIWDFDMVNRSVTVSHSKTYCNSLADSLSIPLISVEKHKELLVHINGKLKRLSLDFGCSSPISLAGSIPNINKTDEKQSYSTKTKGVLNHLASKERKDNKFNFVDVQFGKYEFKEIQCFENDCFSLLGIPFVWSFKRVVVDFMNNKAYFIQLNENAGNFGVMKFTRQTFYNWDGVTILTSKPEGMTLLFEQDSKKISYLCFGKLRLYKNNNQLDSISCSDSIRLPDGKIKVGPVTVKIDSINKSPKGK